MSIKTRSSYEERISMQKEMKKADQAHMDRIKIAEHIAKKGMTSVEIDRFIFFKEQFPGLPPGEKAKEDFIRRIIDSGKKVEAGFKTWLQAVAPENYEDFIQIFKRVGEKKDGDVQVDIKDSGEDGEDGEDVEKAIRREVAEDKKIISAIRKYLELGDEAMSKKTGVDLYKLVIAKAKKEGKTGKGGKVSVSQIFPDIPGITKERLEECLKRRVKIVEIM